MSAPLVPLTEVPIRYDLTIFAAVGYSSPKEETPNAKITAHFWSSVSAAEYAREQGWHDVEVYPVSVRFERGEQIK